MPPIESPYHGTVSQSDLLKLMRLRRCTLTTRDYIFGVLGLDIKKQPFGAPVAFYFALNQINYRLKRKRVEIRKVRDGTSQRAYGDEAYELWSLNGERRWPCPQ